MSLPFEKRVADYIHRLCSYARFNKYFGTSSCNCTAHACMHTHIHTHARTDTDTHTRTNKTKTVSPELAVLPGCMKIRQYKTTVSPYTPYTFTSHSVSDCGSVPVRLILTMLPMTSGLHVMRLVSPW